MSIFLIVIGIASAIYGTLRLTGFIQTDTSQDSEMDKRLISDKNRYFIGRYLSGFKLIIAGIGAIALGVILYLSK